MAYDTNGVWKPEDDSSVSKLNGMLDSGSPYLEMATATGQRQAQSRGLQNSTMAGTAGQAAAIAAAQPFALADAASTAQKNLSFQGFGQQSSLDKANNDAVASRQTADLAAQAERQRVDVGATSDRLKMQIASNETIADREAQNKLALQQLTTDSQQKIANMNVTANAQDKAQNAALSASNIYTQNINAIIGNANIPPDARASLMDNAKNELNANISMIETLYNIKLNWTAPSTPSAASGYGGATATSQSEASNNYNPPNVGVQTLFGGFNGYNGPVGYQPQTGQYIDASGNITT